MGLCFGYSNVFNQEFMIDKQLAHHSINLLSKNTKKLNMHF